MFLATILVRAPGKFSFPYYPDTVLRLSGKCTNSGVLMRYILTPLNKGGTVFH